MICPSCGYENREDARYCNLCQTSFVKTKPEPRPLPRRIVAAANDKSSGSRSSIRITPLHIIGAAVILFAIIFFTARGVFSDDLGKVDCMAVDDITFRLEVLESPVPVLVVFCDESLWNRVKSEYVPEYGCRAQPAPTIMAMKSIIKDDEYENNVKFCKYYLLLATDPAAKSYDIDLIPTTLLFHNGSVFQRFDGPGCNTEQSREEFEIAFSEVFQESGTY